MISALSRDDIDHGKRAVPSIPKSAKAPAGVVMIGTFPPPVYGASKNNELLRLSLEHAGVETFALNTAAAGISLRRTVPFHFQRVIRNLQALYRAYRLASKGRALYLVPNGGAGIIYTVAQLGVAAAGYGRVMLHHRTFRYIDTPSRAMAGLLRILPEDCWHVFLSEGMARRFQERYGPVDAMVASNARFVAEEASAELQDRQQGPIRIGHLSNLCKVKGFFEVADCFETLRAMGTPAQLYIAGPVIEPEVQARLDGLLQVYGPDVRWFGAIGGEAKRDFYRSLDLFLFPTQYDKEAAPNVIYEALSAGVPAVATHRGSIGEIVTGDRGLLVNDAEQFAELAAEFAAHLPLAEPLRSARAREIKASLAGEAALSELQYGALLSFLGADGTAAIEQDF